MNSTTDPATKVLFRVPEEDGTASVETLWAHDLGSDQYRLDNLPFYAYSVSPQDVVYAPHDPDEGRPTFKQVISKSGNRTIRIAFDLPVESDNVSRHILDLLVALGCGYEGANRKFIAVNIPPDVGLSSVCNLLVQRDVNWEHADPTYEEIYGNDA